MRDERQVLVTLLDTERGERVTFPYEYGFHEFLWTEGNYSCDCNRHMFFWEAKGTGLEDISCNTGPNRYKLTSVVDAEQKKFCLQENNDFLRPLRRAERTLHRARPT